MNETNQYGILSGNEIRQRMSKGDIIIHPYNDQQLGPNSYNLCLLDRMLVYTEAVLDPRRDNRTREIIIPPEGYVLKPGRVYIASTEEWTETYNLVPMCGEILDEYAGKYVGQEAATPSRLFQEMGNAE